MTYQPPRHLDYQSEFLPLHEKVQAARYEDDPHTKDVLIRELDQHTSDGTLITLGLHVIDYNREHTNVVNVQSVEITGTIWFTTANGGMFDGSRLQAVR